LLWGITTTLLFQPQVHVKVIPLQFYYDNIFFSLQFLGRGKDNGVRRSVVSGKKVCLILRSGDVLGVNHRCTLGSGP
jgi:hypothetical protein